MLHACFVRSPFAHAEIAGIDTEAAKAAPGVTAVLTHADLAPHLAVKRLVTALPSDAYRHILDRQILAEDEVCHVGEPVAVVVAADRYAAEDAAALVDVDYNALPAVSDCRDALAPDAPSAHRRLDDNLLAEYEIGYGDVDAAFAAAAHRVSVSLRQHKGLGLAIECRGVVAAPDPLDDRLTVWLSCQAPHGALRALVAALGLDERRIVVRAADLGGGFGPKLVVYPEDIAIAHAARRLGRPVKWIEDRREHFTATTQERDQYWDMEAAVDEDGTAARGPGDDDPRPRRLYRARPQPLLQRRHRGSGTVSPAGLSPDGAGGGDQQGADHAGPRRRPPAGHVRDGADRRPRRRDARPVPRRGAAAEFHRGGRDALCPPPQGAQRHRDRARQRRLPGLPGGRARGRRHGGFPRRGRRRRAPKGAISASGSPTTSRAPGAARSRR